VIPWYAVRTKAKHEAVAARFTEGRGVGVYLPVYEARRQWSDRVKVIEMPLFSGYFFARVGHEERVKVLEAPGVVGLVGFGGEPAPIPDCEIENIQKALRSGLPASPCPYVKVGDKVRIRSGPLVGLEGILQKVKNRWRFILTVDLLQKGVSIEVDSETVEAVR
jgi:transcription antitermination factor NusG